METAINNENHPVELLKNEYIVRRKQNANYSLTAYARDLGLSVSFLSRLLRGERSITVNQAIQVCTLLGLSSKQVDVALASLVKNANKNSKISQKYINAITQKKTKDEVDLKSVSFFEVEHFKVISEWYHLAILNLTKVKGFNPDSVWLAKRLGITRIEADAAVTRLIDLGLLERKRNTLVRTKTSLYIKTSQSERAIREFTKQTMQIAAECLTHTSPEAYAKRCMPGTTLAIDSRMLPFLKEKILKFQIEFAELADSGRYDEVYQFNLQLFPLTKINPEKKDE